MNVNKPIILPTTTIATQCTQVEKHNNKMDESQTLQTEVKSRSSVTRRPRSAKEMNLTTSSLCVDLTNKSATKNSGDQKSQANSKPSSGTSNSKENDPIQCEVCHKSGPKTLIDCEVCDMWVCGKCANLKADAMRLITSLKEIHWYCDSCQHSAVYAVSLIKIQNPTPRATPTVTDSSGPATKLDAVVTAALNMMDKKIEQTISKLENKITTYTDKVNKLATYADRVKGTGTISAGIQVFTPSQPGTSNQVQLPLRAVKEDTAEVDHLKELQEREDRRNNLVVYGISESKSNTSDIRKLHDTTCFKEICDDALGIGVDIISTTRLGAKKPGSDRPLRVELADNRSKSKVLRNAKYLAASEEEYLRKVFINKDMTFLERQEDRKLRQELRAKRDQAKEAGEKAKWIIRRGKLTKVRDSNTEPSVQVCEDEEKTTTSTTLNQDKLEGAILQETEEGNN